MNRKQLLQFASAIDIPVDSEFLPACFKPKGEKVKSVNAGKILAKIFKHEDAIVAKNEAKRQKAAHEARVEAYRLQVESTGSTGLENDSQDSPEIDRNYLLFYGKLVTMGIAEPITEDDILEWEFDRK